MLIRRRRLRVEIEQLQVLLTPVQAPGPTDPATRSDSEAADPVSAHAVATSALPVPTPSLPEEDAS
jgi:hypothetical protein